MKKYILVMMAASLCVGCEQKIEPGQPSETNTTIVNPPADSGDKTVEKNTTVVTPPAPSTPPASSSSTTTTTDEKP